MIRVLLADDHPVVREGLRRILTSVPWARVVADASDGDAVLRIVGSEPVDVVLLDVSMPGLSFLEVLQRLRQEHPRVRVLVLSVHPEDQLAVRCLRAGAAGYLTKDHAPGELLEAVRRIGQGGRYVTPSLAERLVEELDPSRALPHEALSHREFQALCLLGSGRSVKEAAADLGVSPKTLSTYRNRLLQ